MPCKATAWRGVSMHCLRRRLRRGSAIRCQSLRGTLTNRRNYDIRKRNKNVYLVYDAAFI
eukprot:15476100-Alexandrium_andersonii.AAC.1